MGMNDEIKNGKDFNLHKSDVDSRFGSKEEKLKHKRLGLLGIPALAAIVAGMVFVNGTFAKNGTLKVSAQDLMKEITRQKVETIGLKDEFIKATADFSVELFKQAYTKNENSLVSPTSVYLALGMTANGAEGNTLKEFESLLGKYNINMKDLNSYYNSLSEEFTKVDSGKISISNSIWYNDNKSIDVKRDFLQANADYYNASIYKSDFNNKKTMNDINNWVKFNTDNKVDKIIDKIDSTTVMYLINAMTFEDKWKNIYEKSDVRKGKFKLISGGEKDVEYMNSSEEWYIHDEMADGFIKPYKDGKYSFVALLPKENVSIDNYISSLSGENFLELLKNKTNEWFDTSMPRFEAKYEVDLSSSLKKMGLNNCFDMDNADFSKMAVIDKNNIFIASVLHKTFIMVDTEGTKAAAATKVEIGIKSAPSQRSVILNRPFVYAIINNETNLPIFIGTMMKPQ
jgi:serpin B